MKYLHIFLFSKTFHKLFETIVIIIWDKKLKWMDQKFQGNFTLHISLQIYLVAKFSEWEWERW